MPKFRKGFAPTAGDAVAALKGVICTRCPVGKESQIAQMIANAMPAELAGAIAGSLAGCSA